MAMMSMSWLRSSIPFSRPNKHGRDSFAHRQGNPDFFLMMAKTQENQRFAGFFSEKNYQRGMWIKLWILWINSRFAGQKLWKLWITLWKSYKSLWNTGEFPVERVCKSDY